MMIKKKLLVLICVLGISLISAGAACALELDFSNLVGSYIQIIGNQLSFSAGDNLSITNVFNGTGDAASLHGQITNPSSPGYYTIGAISTNTDGDQYATLTGTGQIIIHDGSGNDFSADVDWINIYQSGTGNTLNVKGAVNLASILYPTGSIVDLQDFASYPAGYATVTFQFTGAPSLENVVGDGQTHQASFSGAMVAVPLPPSALLLGTGLIGLVGLRFRGSKKG